MTEMERHSEESAQAGSGNLRVSQGLTTELTPEQETGDPRDPGAQSRPAHHQLSSTLSPLSQQTSAEAAQGQGWAGARGRVTPRCGCFRKSSASGEVIDTSMQSKDGM
ncbi:unnamed protein product [Rangifer tarandus platyrhynchus]|uniref:Uncharacterized protein n=1 Tax=Rangifer tarandus platyrhynchus TaxID=3082113 RepID=A0ABN8Z172_RANTA|nr:unnamed protein product [Rangifer tarandus platyrhynchus]